MLLAVCEKYAEEMGRVKLEKLGLYTLEIYVTHVCVNRLMSKGDSFFTLTGFGLFVCSLILTIVFTTIIIAAFKSIPIADFLFYGKKKKKV